MAYIDDSFAPSITDGDTKGSPRPWQELTDDGAITIAEGVVFLNKAGVIAATLADPPLTMTGAILHIVSLSAQAHTVTNTTGIGGGAGSNDVATWGGAIGDALTLVAKAGVWHTLSLDGVSLG